MRPPLSFMERLVVEHGGLVEWNTSGDSINVLLSRDVQRAFDLSDPLAVLTTVSGQSSTSTDLAVGFGTALLERGIAFSIGGGRTAAVQLAERPAPRKVTEELGRWFSPANAVFRLEDERYGSRDYWVWSFWIAIESDERRDSLLHVALSEDRAECPHVVDIVSDRTREWAAVPRSETTRDQAELRALRIAACERALRGLAPDLAEFKQSVTRRYERDRKRTRAYFDDLHVEMDLEIRRRRLTGADLEIRRQKQDQLANERSRKIEALVEKYRIRIGIRPIALLLARLPVHFCDVLVLRRKSSRMFTLAYNEPARCFEPLACEACGASTLQPGFCDDHLHLLCPSCLAKGHGRAGRACVACAGRRPASTVDEVVEHAGYAVLPA